MPFGISSEWEVDGLIAASKPKYKGMPVTGEASPFLFCRARLFKNVVAQFIGRSCLINQATTEI